MTWSPFPAEPIALTDTKGTGWTLADHKGRNVVVLFFLGGKCAHCMQQLQVFGKEFEALKLDKFRRLVRHVRKRSAYYRRIIAERNIDVDRCQRATFRF